MNREIFLLFLEHKNGLSAHVYLGSRLTLTCEIGYVINDHDGSKTIDCKPHVADRTIDWDDEIPRCQLAIATLQPTTDFINTSHSLNLLRQGKVRFWIVILVGASLALVFVFTIIALTYVIQRHRSISAEVIHSYEDMSGTRVGMAVSDGIKAPGLPGSSHSRGNTTPHQRQTPSTMHSAVVADADIDAFGYTLPRCESGTASMSMGRVFQCHVDQDDGCDYQGLGKREESEYTELV